MFFSLSNGVKRYDWHNERREWNVYRYRQAPSIFFSLLKNLLGRKYSPTGFSRKPFWLKNWREESAVEVWTGTPNNIIWWGAQLRAIPEREDMVSSKMTCIQRIVTIYSAFRKWSGLTRSELTCLSSVQHRISLYVFSRHLCCAQCTFRKQPHMFPLLLPHSVSSRICFRFFCFIPLGLF